MSTDRSRPTAGALGRFRARVDAWSVVKSSLPPLLALSALAVTQPLLDLFGANPEFFVASDMTKPEIVGFARGRRAAACRWSAWRWCWSPPPSAARGARSATDVLVAVLAFALGLTVARQLGPRSDPGGRGVRSPRRRPGDRARDSVRGLPPGCCATWPWPPSLSWRCSCSRRSPRRCCWNGEAEAAAGVTVGSPAPVVFIVLDEVPVASLMRGDGTLNEERFPNFARLAAAGTWYRDASSVSPNTPLSVPTILDGDLPPGGGLPTSVDHPDNLFTLLGSTYDLDVTETVTELCPGSVCAGRGRSVAR